ncbi:hypothetical protein SAMN02799625_04681 [Methylobacterium sp. UNC300MFChir4.1]|uniref:hypothetical protein n=1 Tax=Methylobacterium sp. UNC300MFChir4.1 TaxID=1502747 RepID=UPI0008BA61BE|nr:hypothetical protein [Methylobacterium sp. UNC300MFChir4.1]SEP10137.1 hypothetical protein SAMN02799625_04681 [Methylobacterium sp. UNC300MFChir4.1]
MQGFDAETAARVIAENAVDAFMRERVGALGLKPGAREAAIGATMLELMGVLPSDDSVRLAAACNRGLEVLIQMGVSGPCVEGVDPDDGSVTMQVM